jgi:hypothetical protein
MTNTIAMLLVVRPTAADKPLGPVIAANPATVTDRLTPMESDATSLDHRPGASHN